MDLLAGRRLPCWSELKPLIKPRPLELDATRRRLARAHTIEDMREIARRRVPRAVFDYVDGAADNEVSLRRARESFGLVEFRPRVLRDVSTVETRTEILGRPAAMPLVFGPTGFTRMVNHEGETAVVRAAAKAGIPYALSTMGTTSIEDVAAASDGATTWFQLYVWRDRDLSEELIARARDAGYHALVVTVDVPVAGKRLRDVRSGFSIPPALSARTVLDASLHPAWWFNLLTTEPLRFASLTHESPDALASIVNSMFDPSTTFEDLAHIRELWDGPLIVKGIHVVEDAVRVADLGADALVVSNHGGRQLDRAVTPLEVLPDVVDAVGDRVEVLFDSGIDGGADVAAAVAFGAKACLIGRAYLYGLMVGGQRGVDKVAEIISTELSRTLQLLGVTSVADLDRSVVRLRR